MNERVIDIIGWVSSVVLVLTLSTQVRKQWRERSCVGVSRWLFVGQTFASIGFLTYSILLSNWVFTVTNALILVSALVGQTLVLRFKRERASLTEARLAQAAASAPPIGGEPPGIRPGVSA